jgi:hypothetical protein
LLDDTLNDKSKKKQLDAAIAEINNNTEWKKDYQPPTDEELGMGGYKQVVDMKNEAMIENKKRLIYIDQTTVKAMEATDPVRFASLVAPESDSIYGEGPVDSQQVQARPLLNTGERVWLVIIHSMHTSYGLGTPHTDVTRIDGLIKNITILDIFVRHAGSPKNMPSKKEGG